MGRDNKGETTFTAAEDKAILANGVGLKIIANRIGRTNASIQGRRLFLLNKINKAGMPLTPKEINILSLLAKGNTAKEVGKKINISYRTIECYRRIIIQKLRGRNIVHAVVIALRNKELTMQTIYQGNH